MARATKPSSASNTPASDQQDGRHAVGGGVADVGVVDRDDDAAEAAGDRQQRDETGQGELGARHALLAGRFQMSLDDMGELFILQCRPESEAPPAGKQISPISQFRLESFKGYNSCKRPYAMITITPRWTSALAGLAAACSLVACGGGGGGDNGQSATADTHAPAERRGAGIRRARVGRQHRHRRTQLDQLPARPDRHAGADPERADRHGRAGPLGLPEEPTTPSRTTRPPASRDLPASNLLDRLTAAGYQFDQRQLRLRRSDFGDHQQLRLLHGGRTDHGDLSPLRDVRADSSRKSAPARPPTRAATPTSPPTSRPATATARGWASACWSTGRTAARPA